MGGSAYAVYLEITDPINPITTQLLLILVLACGVAAVVNYLLFHYVSVDENEIRQAQYFGLMRRVVPTYCITRIDEGRVRPSLVTFSTLRICSPEQSIEFIPDMYERSAVREAIRRLRTAGVPIDDNVLRRYMAT